MDLAPTSSTTATLAMGDALAVALLGRRGFRAADFARLHPGGSLGRRLTLRVRDVMVAEDYPAVEGDAAVRDIIVPLARMRGTVPVIDDGNALVGVVTAGDVARLMERSEDFLDLAVSSFMTRAPRIAAPDELGATALRRMEKHGVMALPVVGAAYGWYFRRVLPRLGSAVSGHGSAYAYLPASVGTFPGPAAFCRLLEEAGFRDARAVPLQFGIVYLYEAARAQ